MGVLGLINSKNNIGFKCNDEFVNMLGSCGLTKFQFDVFLSHLNILGYKQSKKSSLVLNAKRVNKNGVLWDISCNGIDGYIQVMERINSKTLYVFRVNNGDNYCEYILDMSKTIIYKYADYFKFANNNATLTIIADNIDSISRDIIVKYNDDYREIDMVLSLGYRVYWSSQDNGDFLWLVEYFSNIKDKEELSAFQLVNMLIAISGSVDDLKVKCFKSISIRDKVTGELETVRNGRRINNYFYSYPNKMDELFGYAFEKNDNLIVINKNDIGCRGLCIKVYIGNAWLTVEFNNYLNYNVDLELIKFSNPYLMVLVNYLYGLSQPVSMEAVYGKCLEFVSNFDEKTNISMRFVSGKFDSIIETENGKCTYIKILDGDEITEWKNDGSCSYSLAASQDDSTSVFISSDSKIKYNGPFDAALLEGKIFNPISAEMYQIVSKAIEKQKEMNTYALGFSKKKI